MRRSSAFHTAFLLPFLTLCIALALVAVRATPALAKDKVPAVDLETAVSDLEALEGFLKKKKSFDADLTEYLEAVARAYGNLVPLTAPEKIAEDASEEEKAAHADAMKAFEREKRKYDKAVEGFHKDAAKALLKGFALFKANREDGSNLRVDVNLKAAELIGGLSPRMAPEQREKMSDSVMKAIGKLDKAKYRVNTDFLDAAFASLAAMDRPASLEWMLDEHIHTRTKEEDVDRMMAALKAMVLFPTRPGKLRHAVVEEMIKSFVSVEAAAEQASNDPKIQSKKAYWDRIKLDVIKVMQVMAGESAIKEDGGAFNRMDEFQTWFRDHKNARKAPWVDPR